MNLTSPSIKCLRTVLLLGCAVTACSSSPGTGGSGGTTGSGGAASGGSSGSGGSSASGGTTSSGGSSASGGTTSTGGKTSSGGATSTGGVTSTGGATSTGGTSSTGGTTSSGGSSASGGTTSTGGTTSSGGAGGAGKGGAAGGTSGSGGAAGGSSGGACPYKFCEDFEKGTVGGIPTGWTALKGFGSATTGVGLATDEFHSGGMSVKSESMATGGQRIQYSLASLGATATNHWGRLYYKVKTPAPKGANNAYYHVTFAALQGTTENRVVDTVEDPNGKIQYIFNLPDDSCCTGSDYNWTHDGMWHCAEWHVDVSAKAYRFFIDKKEVTQIAFTGNSNAKMSNYTALGIGAIFYVNSTGTWTSWIDDVALDDKQIGCD